MLTSCILKSGPGFATLNDFDAVSRLSVQRNEYFSVLLCFAEPEPSL